MSGPPDSKASFNPDMITSMLPDGTILQFPKGTDPAIVDRVFKEQLGEWMKNQPQQAAQPEVGTGKAAAIGATQGLTFNLGDEIAAGMGATIGRPGSFTPFEGGDWSQRYDNALNEARGVQHAAQDQHPVAFGAGKVAGAVAPALIAPEAFGANYVAAAPTLASAASRGALTSGLYGAATGFNEGEGSIGDRAVSAAKGGAIGAAAGAVISPIVKSAGDFLTGTPKPSIVPASKIAKDAGSAAYKSVDDAGVVLSPSAISRLRDTVKADLADWGIKPELEPRAMAAFKDIENAANSGENLTLKGLELIRRVAGRATNSASDAEASQKIIQHIDDFMSSIAPEDVVMGAAGDAVKALQTARGNWSAYAKSDMIEKAILKAQDRASSTGTGGNVVNAIRQNLRSILDNPSKSRGFTQDELAAIRDVVRGGKMENIARLASIFAPSRGGINAWMATIASMIPGGQVLPAIGEGAHAAAQKMTGDAARALPGLILSKAPVAASLPTIPPYSAAVAKALGAGVPVAATSGQAWADALLNSRGPQQ